MTTQYYTSSFPAVIGDVVYLPAFINQSEKVTCPANEYVSSSDVGLTATSLCGTGYAGTMTWTCGQDGTWTNNKDSVCKKSSIIDGFPDNYIYYGGAAIFALLVILMI